MAETCAHLDQLEIDAPPGTNGWVRCSCEELFFEVDGKAPSPSHR